jgi:glycosyltransferase involved in cell wall biosynthesis
MRGRMLCHREGTMRTPIKVVYLIEELALGGGIETVILALLRGLDRERFLVEPWFLANTGPSFERCRALFPATRFLDLQTYHRPGPLRRLAHELRRTAPDLVHGHGYFAGSFARLVAPWLRLPWVYSLYSHYEDVYTWNNYTMEWLLSKTRGTVVACSEVVKRFAVQRCRIPEHKVVVNYEGVDVSGPEAWPDARAAREHWGVPSTALVFGIVTRFYPGKSVDVLIRAFAGLPPECHLLIAGNGPEEGKLRGLVGALHLTERVHFTGLLEEVALALVAMDVFVQMSRMREGFSLALVEALAYARPVIATAVGGNCEAVTPELGWLVPSDDVPSLHAALQQAVAQRAQLPAKGQAARERYLKHFTGKHMVTGMQHVYTALAGGA